MEDNTQAVEAMTESILASRKYRSISLSLIQEVARRELPRRRNMQEATKAARSKLHQIAGAFIEEQPPYAKWLVELEAAREDGEPALIDACLRIMKYHSSARERVPSLRDFYTTVFDGIGPIDSILDIACGLNPLSIPWMPIAQKTRYFAVDIYSDLIAFLGDFLRMMEQPGTAIEHNIIGSVPDIEVDVVLVLKTIPCLEQVDPAVGRRLLEGLRARVMLVSFPARSLGGRNRGMIENYSAHFADLVQGHDWKIERFLFATELVFRVTKGRD